jgi:hypothetical protein
MMITKPGLNETITITSDAEWPSVTFETDGSGTHTWYWTITWGKFKKSGRQTTTGNVWDARTAICNYGGTLTVRAEANKAGASLTVKIKGTNPTAGEVRQYLATKPDNDGFERIIEHESKFRHFAVNNEPVKSFDSGYGMCQLTTPPPTFEQVWNWKLNVDGGLALFAQKRLNAITYLRQSNRSYTNEQLRYETVCRWNGGAYHEWDSKAGQWVRPSHILCDSQTGNIGWNMNDPDNKDKTETELHKRDSGTYSNPPGANSQWRYYGVCYADRILG